MKKITISGFNGINPKVKEVTTLESYLNRIKNGRDKDALYTKREFIKNGKNQKVDRLKIGLYSITPSCLCRGRRSEHNITNYNGIICLDYDHVKNRSMVKKQIAELPFVLSVFKSVTDGLKVLIPTNNTNPNLHSKVMEIVDEVMFKNIGLRIDKQTKDVARLCFTSYDPKIYINWEATKFEAKLIELNTRRVRGGKNAKVERNSLFAKKYFGTPLKVYLEERAKEDEEIREMEKPFKLFYLQKLYNYLEENKLRLTRDNERWYKVASVIARDLGEEGKEMFMELCRLDKEEHDEKRSLKEWDVSLKKTNRYKNVTWGSLEHFAKEEGFVFNQEVLEDGDVFPTIPQSVYEKLPVLLKKGTAILDKQRDKDVLLLGTLSVLGGYFPMISGYYGDEKLYPNLYCFITAPPSAGKGALKWVKHLGQPLHEKHKKEYLKKVAEYEANNKQDEKPVRKLFYVPGNVSHAAFVKYWAESNGELVLLESEADTLTGAIQQEWGNFSDLLRKAYHHETVSSLRKGEEGVEIDSPKLSFVLTGTPDQVISLIKNTENGLFSRIMFYQFTYEQEWNMNLFKRENSTNYPKHYNKLGEEILELRESLLDEKIEFMFTLKQQEEFNKLFSKNQSKFSKLHGEKSIATVRRLGIMCFRIAMLLTVLRIKETGIIEDELECSDTDFKSTMEITKCLLKQSEIMLEEMPSISKKKYGHQFTSAKQHDFFNALPEEFVAKETKAVAKELDVPENTRQAWLKKFESKSLLDKYKHGHYRKIS